MSKRKAAEHEWGLSSPAPEKPKPARDPAIAECIDAYFKSFLYRFNPQDIADAYLRDRKSVPADEVMTPIIHGAKDGAHIKKMIATWGVTRTLKLCREFCYMTNPRVLRSDYSIGAMFSLAQYLLIDAGRPDERTAHNIHEAARASGRSQ